jgi:methionyl-tRNA formyltransferase
VNTLVGMTAGTVQPQVQPHELATHAPKCQKEDAILNWQESAQQLQLKIRAFNPAPGAATFLSGERIKLLQAQVYQSGSGSHSEEILKSGQPGQLLAIIETGLLVRTGEGVLEIQSLQPAGKREMPARDWALGLFKPDSSGKRSLGCFTNEANAPQPA